MPAPTSAVEFLELVKKSGLVAPDSYSQVSEATLPPDPSQAAGVFVKRGWLTNFQAKQLLAGRYRGFRIGSYIVREQIGQGGMGIVYLAEHEQLRRRVALKVLTSSNDDARNITLERFLREARAAAALDHPNIVRIHDVGQHGHVHFLVMEFVEGRSLESLIEASGPVSAGRAVGYVAQAAAGLLHAHERNFIHRDIKPGNLMLQSDGSIKILDMGLARSFDNPGDKLTEQFDAGAVVGTADFISPEQALNDPNIDHRADIYSLGATFYALVTGQPPFTGNTTQKLMQHQMREAPPLALVDKTFPKELSDVIAKMMAKQPHTRYESMAEVIEALAPWIPDAANMTVGTGRTSSSGSLRTPAAYEEEAPPLIKGTVIPKWTLYATAAVGTVLVLGGVIWALSQPSSVKEQMGTNAVGETPPAQQKTNPPPKSNPQPKAGNNTKSPATKGSTPRPAGQVVYKFNASEIPAFQAKYRGQSAFEGTTPAIPNGLTIHCWKPESEGAFSRTTVAGKPAFGIANLNDGKTAQLRIDLEPKNLVTLTPGRQYIVRLEYMTDGEATGQIAIQGKEFSWIKGVDLGPTGGAWKTVTATIDKEADNPIQFGFDAKMEPNTGTLYLGTFEVIDPTAPPPSAGGPMKTAYKLNLAGAKPYLARVVCEGTDTDKVNRSISQSGEGLPAGWEHRVWRPGSTAEFLVSDETGTQALGIRTIDGKAGGMLFLPEHDSPEPRCVVTFDYKSSKPNLSLGVKFRGRDAMPGQSFFVKKLTGGTGWTTATIPIEQRGVNSGRIEIQIEDDEPDATLWIKNVSIQVPGSAAAAPARDEKAVFDFEASAVAEFRARKLKQSVTTGSVPSFPPGVGVTCWKDNSEGEFWRDDHDGVAVLGIASHTDGDLVTAQLGVELEASAGVTLTQGKKYKLVVTYATTGTGYGNMYFQFSDYSSIAGQKELPNTGGQWKTVETSVTRGEKGFRFLIDVKGSGLENALLIRSVKVVEE